MYIGNASTEFVPKRYYAIWFCCTAIRIRGNVKTRESVMARLNKKLASILHLRRSRGLRAAIGSALILTVFALAACAPGSYRYQTVSPAAPEERRKLDIRLYYYPKAGQTVEQQSRDHYECYNWAVQQTGFDPNDIHIPTQTRVEVVPVPLPGHDTAAMSVAGAIIGALIAGPRNALGGAAVGAAGGAMIGAASDASRQETARQLEQAYTTHDGAVELELERKAADFRNAMGACLEGRGYSVR